MPNNFNNGGPQFYVLNRGNNIDYINFSEFDRLLKNSLNKNSTFYINFCGISNSNYNVPEYLYLAFNGKKVNYKSTTSNGSYYLEFVFQKSGNTLERDLVDLFTDNVGVFIQGYL
jgi:hypothetical protein